MICMVVYVECAPNGLEVYIPTRYVEIHILMFQVHIPHLACIYAVYVTTCHPIMPYFYCELLFAQVSVGVYTGTTQLC